MKVIQEDYGCERIVRGSKNIFISEGQARMLGEAFGKGYNTQKVLILKKYLDKNFKRGSMSKFGENGRPVMQPIMAMVIPGCDEVKNMTALQTVDLLQDEFPKLLGNVREEELRNFFQKVVTAWYNKKISNYGII